VLFGHIKDAYDDGAVSFPGREFATFSRIDLLGTAPFAAHGRGMWIAGAIGV